MFGRDREAPEEGGGGAEAPPHTLERHRQSTPSCGRAAAARASGVGAPLGAPRAERDPRTSQDPDHPHKEGASLTSPP